MPPSPVETLPEGTLLRERYRVVRAISSGGMGIVYEVVDQRTNARRALKRMLPAVAMQPDLRARFLQEAQLTGSLATDHVVRVVDAGVDQDAPYLVLELLSGEDLQQLVDRRGKLPADEVLVYLSQAAFALQETLAAGIVHRDLKPANLFLTQRDDGSPCVKVLDFGVAKIADPDGSRRKTMALGTPLFMAPEQITGEGDIGPRADLYALAQVAYALLTGEPYWLEAAGERGSAMVMLLAIVEGAKEGACSRALRRTGTRLPADFDRWFFKATSVEPQRRFGGAREQMEVLCAIWQEESARLARFVSEPTAQGIRIPAATVAGPPTGTLPRAAVAPATLPRPAAAPARAAPTAPAARRPRAPRIALAAAAIGVLACAALGVAWLAQSPAASRESSRTADARSSKRDARSSAQQRSADTSPPTPSPPSPPQPPPRGDRRLEPCGEHWCTTFNPPAPRVVTLEQYIEEGARLARQLEPQARLFRGTFERVEPSGTVDSTAAVSVALLYTAHRKGLVVSFTIDKITVLREADDHPIAGWVGELCPTQRALAAARAGGFSLDAPLVVSISGSNGVPFWLFEREPEEIYVNARTCAVGTP